MIFEKEVLTFNILDVIEIKQCNADMFNSGRNFDALSFRYDSDTVIKTETSTHILKGDSVCFFPARVNYTRLSKRDNLIVVHFDSLNYISNEIEYFIPENPDSFAALFKSILDLWNKKETGYKHKCSAILYEIFAECYKQNHKDEDINPKIEKSVRYINENFKNPDISVKTAAEKSFISEVYFRKLFKKEFGVSPRKHIINLRIQNAIGLLSAGYYSLQEVAFMSGFTDYKYFSVEFKAYTGVSPSKYLYNYTELIR